MSHRPQALTIALAGALLLAGCDASGGARALYADAQAALTEGDLDRAETAAAEAAERGGAAYDPLRDFVDGNVAFARCERAAQQAADAGAEPFAWEIAIDRAERARDAWQRAAVSRSDWPEARRNVERALLEIEDLRRKQDEAGGGNRRKEPGGKGAPRVIPPPKPGEDGPEKPEPEQGPGGKQDADPAAANDAQQTELPADQVLRVLDALAEKEKLKIAGRRTRRAEQPGVEKDW